MRAIRTQVIAMIRIMIIIGRITLQVIQLGSAPLESNLIVTTAAIQWLPTRSRTCRSTTTTRSRFILGKAFSFSTLAASTQAFSCGTSIPNSLTVALAAVGDAAVAVPARTATRTATSTACIVVIGVKGIGISSATLTPTSVSFGP